MGLLKFRALVTLDQGLDHDLPSPTLSLGIRAHGHPPLHSGVFSAMITSEDDEPLLPGQANRDVTITVADGHARDCLGSGTRFDLCQGHLVGHGIISRRIFP